MVWDVLNTLVAVVRGTIAGVDALLVPSPLLLTSGDVAAVSSAAGYAAWFFPVVAMGATLALYVAALIVWVSVLLVIQLVEAVTP